RAIDLDILAYDDRIVAEPDLVIPHPLLAQRAFALVPLAEIDADYRGLCAALPEAERAAARRLEEV
ncbi:MAG: 2-amino-4-hydroxy-6-hydroxymethyldihydropteridine diphosphokinase, partial [Candidatus Eremiobacteraeota bacterium]|nr:2-amino-4-hydroxy-6-hydroxymethyldihydropteridine diphosphokinase [Candidatus Eremiobacteraeota bacterium]